MIEIALLVLTLTAEGDVRMTLSPAESYEACDDTRYMINSILGDAGYEIVTARCSVTPLRLTAYEHGLGPDARIHRYRVALGAGEAYRVTPLAAGDACEPMPAIHCARSTQSVVSGP